MATLDEAIELVPFTSDRGTGVFKLALEWGSRMSSDMRDDRSPEQIREDCLTGPIGELSAANAIELDFDGSGALKSCFEQLKGQKALAGPDFLLWSCFGINVKTTNLNRYNVSMERAFDITREFRLSVKIPKFGSLDRQTKVYMQLFLLDDRCFFVGWASRNDVLNLSKKRDGTYKIGLSDLRSPRQLGEKLERVLDEIKRS